MYFFHRFWSKLKFPRQFNLEDEISAEKINFTNQFKLKMHFQTYISIEFVICTYFVSNFLVTFNSNVKNCIKTRFIRLFVRSSNETRFLIYH